MFLKRLGAVAAVMLGLLALAGPLAAAPLSLTYRAYAGGLHAMDFRLRVDASNGRYAVSVSGKTESLVGSLFPYRLEAEAGGAATPEGFQPQRFQTRNIRPDKEELRAVTFLGAGAVEVKDVPFKDRDPAEAVPQEMLVGAVDPVTAILSLMPWNSKGAVLGCQGEAIVFDGIRRFDLAVEKRQPVRLDANDYHDAVDEALACEISAEPVAGFTEKRAKRFPRRFEVVLGSPKAGLPPLPLVIQSDLPLVKVRIHLVSAEPVS